MKKWQKQIFGMFGVQAGSEQAEAKQINASTQAVPVISLSLWSSLFIFINPTRTWSPKNALTM
jgi:hypothetical protein